jgi:hypothetical protein
MNQSPEQRDLADAIARMRAAVLAASFRKLRYRLSPDEITTPFPNRNLTPRPSTRSKAASPSSRN